MGWAGKGAKLNIFQWKILNKLNVNKMTYIHKKLYNKRIVLALTINAQIGH